MQTKWQTPTWDDLSYNGERLFQQFLENKLGEARWHEMNIDLGSRIGIMVRPYLNENTKLNKKILGNLHIIINGRDQGVIQSEIVIDDILRPIYAVIDCYGQTTGSFERNIFITCIP